MNLVVLELKPAECDGINMAVNLSSRCVIDGCMCEDFR